jgi:hypothetical protein
MYYIFNNKGICISSSDAKPDILDLMSRDEAFIYSNNTYNLTSIELIDGELSLKKINKDNLSELKNKYITILKQKLLSTQLEATLHLEGIITDTEYKETKDLRIEYYSSIKKLKKSNSIEEINNIMKIDN